MSAEKVVLITGSARRVGAVIARTLHAQNMRVIIHYRSSEKEAKALCDELNARKPKSALTLAADLHDTMSLPKLIQTAADAWGRLDVLINNKDVFGHGAGCARRHY